MGPGAVLGFSHLSRVLNNRAADACQQRDRFYLPDLDPAEKSAHPSRWGHVSAGSWFFPGFRAGGSRFISRPSHPHLAREGRGSSSTAPSLGATDDSVRTRIALLRGLLFED